MASKCTNESNVWQHMEKIGNSKVQCHLCLRQLASLVYIHNDSDLGLQHTTAVHADSRSVVSRHPREIGQSLVHLARCLPLWEGGGGH